LYHEESDTRILSYTSEYLPCSPTVDTINWFSIRRQMYLVHSNVLLRSKFHLLVRRNRILLSRPIRCKLDEKNWETDECMNVTVASPNIIWLPDRWIRPPQTLMTLASVGTSLTESSKPRCCDRKERVLPLARSNSTFAQLRVSTDNK